MKEISVVLVKVLVWLGFIINTGLFKVITTADNSPNITIFGVDTKRQEHTRDEEMRFSSRMFLWEQGKEKLAQDKIDKGLTYSADNYFADLREYTDSCVKFGKEPMGLFMNRLQYLSLNSAQDQDDLKAIRSKYLPELIAKEKDSTKNFPTLGEIGTGLCKWFFRWYKSCILLALVLFLAWFYEENEYTKVRFRNPLSFLISLILYPIVIGYNVAKWWRDKRGEVEIRRSKDKIFSLLSKDEIALVKKFAKSNIKIKEFREQLRIKGYVSKHRFVPVIFAIFFMSLIPARRLATSANFHKQDSRYQIEKIQYFCCCDPSPGDTVQCLDTIASNVVTLLQEVQYLFYLFVSVPCRGHHRGIDHVPLVVKSNSTRKTFSNQKNKYETIYCS